MFKLIKSFTYTTPKVSSSDLVLETGTREILFSFTISVIAFIERGSDTNKTSTRGVIISLIGLSENSRSESIISLSAGKI